MFRMFPRCRSMCSRTTSGLFRSSRTLQKRGLWSRLFATSSIHVEKQKKLIDTDKTSFRCESEAPYLLYNQPSMNDNKFASSKLRNRLGFAILSRFPIRRVTYLQGRVRFSKAFCDTQKWFRLDAYKSISISCEITKTTLVLYCIKYTDAVAVSMATVSKALTLRPAKFTKCRKGFCDTFIVYAYVWLKLSLHEQHSAIFLEQCCAQYIPSNVARNISRVAAIYTRNVAREMFRAVSASDYEYSDRAIAKNESWLVIRLYFSSRFTPAVKRDCVRAIANAQRHYFTSTRTKSH